MNACPKNVLIGAATGKAPTGGGPADVSSAVAPPGGAFRTKVRATRAPDVGADTHGGGKDPPAAADAPRAASPKRELDESRLAGDTPGPAEAVGPRSPARGAPGTVAPRPPPTAPRRARLGKAMARRSLADTGALLAAGPRPPPPDGDDDVLAVSPPACVPIDLSSSDETERRSTPVIDIKKENEGPKHVSPKKSDTSALRERNATAVSVESPISGDAAKAVKRRYSKPKLEIELRDVELEDGCKTNGIGEHVKLQKRRKVVPENDDISLSSVNKDKILKNKVSKMKNTQKLRLTEKKNLKRKNSDIFNVPQAKKALIDTPLNREMTPIKNVLHFTHTNKDQILTKPKTKSALVLDNLLKKNSADRVDSNNYSDVDDINPAELFLSPSEHTKQNDIHKTININNNIVDNNNVSVNGVRSKTVAAVTQHITKKLSPKIIPEKTERVESNITTHSLSVLKSSDEICINDDANVKEPDSQANKTKIGKNDKSSKLKQNNTLRKNKINAIGDKLMNEKTQKSNTLSADATDKSVYATKPKLLDELDSRSQETKTIKPTDALFEKSVNKLCRENKNIEKDAEQIADKATPERVVKRSKLSIEKGEIKEKCNEKVGKSLGLKVCKKPVIKTDETASVVEEACGSPVIAKSIARRARRRRSGAGGKRARRAAAVLTPPLTDAARAPPRWSNGWCWDGEHFLAKVYVNVSHDTRISHLLDESRVQTQASTNEF